MKKIISYLSLFICAFLLFGSFANVNAAEYDVYETGDIISKQMTSGKTVQFVVVEDQGQNSQYVRVIANPNNLSQFDVKTAYSYNDITSAIASGSWAANQLAITDKLSELWGQSGTAEVANNKISIFTKEDYDNFVSAYSKAKYNGDYEGNKETIDAEIANILKGQTFWAVNITDGTTLGYDRVASGVYTNTDMDEQAKGNAMNLTVSATICKQPRKVCKYDSATDTYYGFNGEKVSAAEYKKQCSNPDTADSNVLILTIIGAGCVLCIVTIGKKMLAR